MGHTVWSQRMCSDIVLKELKEYGRSLGKEDRVVYERLLDLPLKHLGSVAYASSFHVWAFFLLSIMLEQEKRLTKMIAESVHAVEVDDGSFEEGMAY